MGGGLRKPEAVPATVIFENLPPPTSSAIFISRGATEESLEDVLAILEADCSDQEVDVTEDEEQQRRRRPHGSDAYQTELLQDNGFKIIEETMATLDMDDLSSVGSSDEESSDASDEDDLQFLEYCTQIKIVASCGEYYIMLWLIICVYDLFYMPSNLLCFLI